MTACQEAATAAPPVTRPPRALSAATFVSAFDRFVISPMLVLIAAGLGVPLSAVVVTASGYFLAYGLSQPLWGVLSDRFGRVRVIRFALSAAGLTGLASALAPDLAWLAVARIVAGAFFGAVVPTSLTYVGDTVTAARRQRALSDLMAAMATGTALATAFGGVLAQLVDWRAVFATTAACAGLCALSLGALPEPQRAPVAGLGAHLRTVLRERWALLVFGLAFVEGAVLLGTMTLLAAALQDQGLSAAAAGLATAAFGVGVLGFSLLVKRLSVRMPAWSLIALGGAQICLGYGIVSGRIAVATVLVTALLLGGGWSFMHSSLQTWATSVVPKARGTAVAFFAAALFVGSSVAVTAAGPLAEHGRFQFLFGIACAVSVPLTLTAVLCRRRWPAPVS